MTEEESSSNTGPSDVDANAEVDKEETEPGVDQAGGGEQPPTEQQEEIKDGLKSTPVVYISGLLTMLFVLGIYDFATSSSEGNKCTMTYMFEYPQYIEVKLPDQVHQEFPRYKLYVYSEGSLVEYLEKRQFEGIPILFIPGNAGSYKQVRSLASVALRKAIDETKYKIHFDFFAVDFGEEYSGLYGGVLQDQSRFASICVSEILKLYTGQLASALSDEKADSAEIPPESVLVIGHSIGGLVARSLYLHSDFDSVKVNTIVTLATPHKPVFVADADLHKFYSDVNDYWRQHNETTLKHVTLVSIGGGFRDTQVRADLTRHEFANLSILTTSASSVWVSTDHLCIVWCKQLVLALNRVFFDLVNQQTRQLTFDKEIRQQVLEYHLVRRSAGKEFKSVLNGGNKNSLHPPQYNFDKDGLWIDFLKRQFVYKMETKKMAPEVKTANVMIKTFDDPKHDEVTIDAVNMEIDDWVFGCKATTVYKGNRLCETGDNLSHLSHIIPSNGKRKTLRISLRELRLKKGYTHVVVVIPKSQSNAKILVDVYNPKERTVEAAMPRFISFYTSQIVIPKTAPNAVFYNISIKGLDQMWQAYTFQVFPREGKCRSTTHFGLMQIKTSWDQETTQTLIGHNLTNRLTVKLNTPLPGVQEGEAHNHQTDLILYLNPSCAYGVAVRPAISEMWGQMVRQYYPMMLSFMISVTMMVFAHQLKLLAEPDKFHGPEPKFHNFFAVLGSKVSPMSVVMPCRLLAAVLSSAAIASKLPFVTDFALVAESGTDFSLLPIVLFFVAIGLTFVVAAAAWGCVLAFGNSANAIIMKFATGAAPATVAAEVAVDAAVSVVEKFPFVLSFLLIVIGGSCCGSLALCAGTFCHFVHLFNMYKDFVKTKLVGAVQTGSSRDDDDIVFMGKIHFQFSLAILWVLTAILNAPALMAWTQAVQAGTFHLAKDPSQITALVFCLTLPFLWGDSCPDLTKDKYNTLSGVIQFLSILTLLYGSVVVYRVNYFVCAVFMATALHQLLAEPRPPQAENQN